VTPIMGSRSPAPRSTASNAPTRVPVGPAMEVRPPPGRGKERSWSCATSRAWAPPQPGRMTRPRERPPLGAARWRSPGHGGSSAAMGLSWGSRPPSARRRRHRRGKAAGRLHHHRRNARSCRGGWRRHGGLRLSNKLHRHGQHRCAQRCRHHHHHQGCRPHPRCRERPRRGGATRKPGSLPRERRIP
jgi:hypothetical protein